MNNTIGRVRLFGSALGLEKCYKQRKDRQTDRETSHRDPLIAILKVHR